jgi:hypothetical protein
LRNTCDATDGTETGRARERHAKVYPLSSSVPVPLSDTAQVGAPGMAALPVAEMVTAVPLI